MSIFEIASINNIIQIYFFKKRPKTSLNFSFDARISILYRKKIQEIKQRTLIMNQEKYNFSFDKIVDFLYPDDSAFFKHFCSRPSNDTLYYHIKHSSGHFLIISKKVLRTLKQVVYKTNLQ